MEEQKFKAIYNSIFKKTKFEYEVQKVVRQKLMYFLDYLGIAEKSLNYSWDNYGPYTTDLDLYEREQGEVELTDYENNVISELQNCIERLTTQDEEKANVIELLASIHYLYHIKFIRDKKSLFDVLFSRKPRERFANVDLEHAFNLAINII